jgi:hypothetical protein
VPLRIDHGYSVKRSNEVLRGVSIYSGDDRARSATDYHVVRVGMKVSGNVEWLATWDQRSQAMREGEPLSILPASREGMRLPQDSVIVGEVTTIGFPTPLRGSSVDLDLSLTGGSTLGRRALVSLGANSSRDVQTLADGVNTSGVAEKVVRIPLGEAREIPEGAFQGRVQMDSTTQISLQRYGGNWIEVDGGLLALGSSGVTCLTTAGLLSSNGTLTSTAPSSSTLYYVYVGHVGDERPLLRLSATAPSLHRGAYYLGNGEATRMWRFVGWVYLNASTQFSDDTTNRLVVNYYNRLLKPIELKPGYADDNAATTYTTTSTTWTPANAGTNATGSYISNGEDGVCIVAFSTASNSGANTTRIGIGENSAATAASSAAMVGTTIQEISCVYATVPAVGRRTVVLLVNVTAGTGTYLADGARTGGTSDPVLTGLYAQVRT